MAPRSEGLDTPDPVGRTLRIAVVAACPLPERRGTPVRIQRIAEGLQRRGHDVHVVTYPSGSGGFAAPITVHRVRGPGTGNHSAPGPTWTKLAILDPLLVPLLRRVIREHQIDIIHAHHYEGLLVSLVARRGRHTPLIYDAHTLLGSELPSYGRHLPRGAKRALGHRLDRWLPALADHVVSVTDAIRKHLLAETTLRADQITCISNGVECDLFEAPRPAEAAGGPPTIVFTGNLAPYQGIGLLLEAFRQVRAASPTARLRIVTESVFEQYVEQARALDLLDAIDVVTTGFENVPSQLGLADVAVNPRPMCDGIPLKLLNYMAASKPVVSFEGSAPGVEHGRTGWLVPKGDVAAFAQGILTLLDNPEVARQIGVRARQYVEAHHSWEAAAEQVERVYRRLLQR